MKITPLKLLLFIIVIISVVLLKQDSSKQTDNALDKHSLVLAFGDSLTYGKGAPNQSYPIQLQSLIKREVVNAGVSGELSSNGLKRLPSLLQKHHPSLVIICHGGNDLIQKKSKETLIVNLRRMIRLSKQSGAQVLLVGVPNFKLVRFNTEPLYEELADQEGVLYEGEILEEVENSRALKSDRTHPNAKGYKKMAKAFADVLKETGLIN